MSRREAWLSAGLVFLVAVLVRAWAATVIAFPQPEDTAYYVAAARDLVAGRGLVSDAIWSYGTPPLSFPRPAFEVWLPLPAFLAAVPMLAFGPTFLAAQSSSIVVGGIVAVLAWRLAADVAEARRLPAGRARTLALGTGLAAAVFLPLVLHSVLPDSTMLFGALVLGVCLLGARVLRDPDPIWAAAAALGSGGGLGRAEAGAPAGPNGWPRGIAGVVGAMAGGGTGGPGGAGGVLLGRRERLGLADRRVVALGVLIGLAALTRNEAIWLALAWAIAAWRAGRLPREQRVSMIVGAAIPAIVLFVPWAVRDWLAFGSPFPGQALANGLSLRGTDIFAWQETPTLGRYLDAGLGTLVGLRVTGFFHNLVNVLLLLGVPISAIGLVALPWTLTGRALVLPARPTRTSTAAAEPRYVVAGPGPGPGLGFGAGSAAGSAGIGAPGARPAGPPPVSAWPEADLRPSSGGPPPVSAWPEADLRSAPGGSAAGVPYALGTGRQADRPPAFMARPDRLDPLPLPGRGGPASALSLLAWFSAITFVATTLLFPVSTTWGTFLHASAAVQVLLLLSALLALDRLIAEVGRRRGWTRPVAWLGPCLGIAAGALFTLVLLPGFGRAGEDVRARYAALPAAMEAAGAPLEVGGAPVITDFPIYLAYVTGTRALALPDEPPASIIDLAAHFPGTRYLVVTADNEGQWPEATLATSEGLACFNELPLDLPGLVAYEIVCP